MHLHEAALSGSAQGIAVLCVVGAAATAAGTALGLRRMDYERVPQVAIVSSAFFVVSLIHVPLGATGVHRVLSGGFMGEVVATMNDEGFMRVGPSTWRLGYHQWSQCNPVTERDRHLSPRSGSCQQNPCTFFGEHLRLGSLLPRLCGGEGLGMRGREKSAGDSQKWKDRRGAFFPERTGWLHVSDCFEFHPQEAHLVVTGEPARRDQSAPAP
jgi:hypothetical protein